MSDLRKQILVVDDSEMNVDLLKRRLEKRGYDVLSAFSGAEALRIIEEQPVDLVLLDVMMPEMNGVEVLRIIRSTRPSSVLPVIMATAKSDTSDLVEALDNGADDYVVKPIDLESLLARMRVHLRNAQGAPKAPSPSPSVGIGLLLDDKYRLDAILGQGGFGTVYRALHLALKKEVAVKVLHAELLHSDEIVQRFRQEGVAACRVRHPNAVAVIDAANTSFGVPYLVMELLEGTSLADEIAKAGAMVLARCAEIIGPVCEALREAHASGLIHRDIKPANIMLSKGQNGEEVVKVLDFGIAKFVESQPATSNTQNVAAGTPRYMAPERLLGEGSDAKTDVYSIGVTLFEMLSATHPFPKIEGTAVQQAVKQLHATPTPLLTVRPDLPHDLVRQIMGALSRDPKHRPSLSDLHGAVIHWAARWKEPQWPVPELGAYLQPSPEKAPSASAVVGDSPTQVETISGEIPAQLSDLESGDRPTHVEEQHRNGKHG